MSLMHVPPAHGLLFAQGVPAAPPESNTAHAPGVTSPQSPPPSVVVKASRVAEQQLQGTRVVDVVLVVVDAVVVVVVGQTSVTTPPPSVVTTGSTQLLSTRVCGEPPSGHAPALATAAENLFLAFAMQVPSTGLPVLAAF